MNVRTNAAWAPLASGCLIVTATALLIPWHPPDDPFPLEWAWALALHFAFLRELAFGREFVFPFGPWGFLWRGYHPQTYVASLLAWAGFSFLFVESLWRLARTKATRPTAAAVVALAVTIVLFKSRESLLFMLPLLWFLEGRERPFSIRFLALTLATALAALGKFSLLLLVTPLAVLLAFDEVVRRRRPPLSLTALVAAIAGWWLAAGQRLGDLVPFVRNGLEIAGGYADAMALEPVRAVAPFVGFAAASVLLLIFIFAGGRASRRPWPWLDVLAFAIALFFAFKAGFVRWDPAHASAGYGVLLLLIVVGGVMMRRAVSALDMKLQFLLPAMALLAAAAMIVDAEDRVDDNFVQSVSDVATIASGGWQSHRRALQQDHEWLLGNAESKAADLPLRGTVDVYPVLASTVAARAEYAPRPVPQSYGAYTTHLARLNAAHLRVRPPDQILFDVAPIDERFPAIEDSLSWPEILSRYAVARAGASFILLERRARSRQLRFYPIGTRMVSAGEIVPLPSFPGPLWAEIHVEKTFIGRAASFLFRTPIVRMHVLDSDGTMRDYRIPLDLAAGGFLLSPVVGSRDSFASLVEAPLRHGLPRVVAVRLVAPRPFFGPEIRVRLAAIAVGDP